MDRQALYDAWAGTDGYTPGKQRPAWVREHRDDLMDVLDVSEEIPTDASLAAVRDWLERYRGTVTRQLNDAEDGSDPHDAEESDE